MSYNFNQTLRKGKWEIQIDTQAKYGCYEHDDHGEGGGLWFEPAVVGGKPMRELVDFDGRAVLPKDVVTALRDAGYYLDETFN